MRAGFLAAMAVLAVAWPLSGAEKRASLEKKPVPKKASKTPAAPARKAVPKPAVKPKVGKGTQKPELPAKGNPSPPLSPYSSVNGLGMKFVRIGALEVCIWPVRVRDFAVFARASGHGAAPRAGFAQTADHPVVNVTWKDAVNFCEWLTESERVAGRLPAGREYRLPTDREWSLLVGLGEEAGATPEARDLSVRDVYPWGLGWPPPSGAGNFAGEESGLDAWIPGYRDDYPNTAPVGSFAPNAAGIFDIAGNVSQWCRDQWNQKSRDRVLRGSSWFNGAIPLSLLASLRVRASGEMAGDSIGFCVVIAPVGASAPK